MNNNEYRKVIGIAILALLFALISYSAAQMAQITADNALINISNVCTPTVNNTNLAPTVPGEIVGTGERVGDNTTYWNNNTQIELFVYGHANSTGNIAEIHLYINGTKVGDTSGKPLGVAEQNNKTLIATIPRHSFYSVEVVSAHHYNWIEYPYTTCANGTVINITGGTNNHSQLTNLNWSVAGHVIDTNVNFSGNYITHLAGIDNNKFSYIFPAYSFPIVISNGTNDTYMALEMPGLVISTNKNASTACFDSNGLLYNCIEKDVASGNYSGDGTTNRSIPYSLSQKSVKIDIMSNESDLGAIMIPGKIMNSRTGIFTNVTQHDSTQFYVSGDFNRGNTYYIIENGDTSGTTSGFLNYVMYNSFNVTTPGNMITCGINSQTASGNFRCAIYNSTGAYPNALLNESGSIALGAGWTNVSLIVPLSIGRYWTAVQLSSNTETPYTRISGGMYYQSGYAYGAFSATAPGGMANTAYVFNERMNLTISAPVYYWVAI